MTLLTLILNSRYHHSVDDVLTSVQKTEESLRRLKNLREKAIQQTVPVTTSTTERQFMTDDDKIRLQLQFDVMFYVSTIERHQLTRDEINNLVQLVTLIGDSTKIRITN